jgi:hypothetical protein
VYVDDDLLSCNPHGIHELLVDDVDQVLYFLGGNTLSDIERGVYYGIREVDIDAPDGALLSHYRVTF